jgi:hypothetical protein
MQSNDQQTALPQPLPFNENSPYSLQSLPAEPKPRADEAEPASSVKHSDSSREHLQQKNPFTSTAPVLAPHTPNAAVQIVDQEAPPSHSSDSKDKLSSPLDISSKSATKHNLPGASSKSHISIRQDSNSGAASPAREALQIAAALPSDPPILQPFPPVAPK